MTQLTQCRDFLHLIEYQGAILAAAPKHDRTYPRVQGHPNHGPIAVGERGVVGKEQIVSRFQGAEEFPWD